jgi:hypothetical protein
MTECYRLPQGKIRISLFGKDLSEGFLELNPYKELSKHKRPVDEKLIQIEGKSTIKLFDGNNIKEVTLNEGERITIPANQFHIHANPFDKRAITLWKFKGDILNILDNIRTSFPKI